MHELALMTHLLERVEAHAARLDACRVVAINLVVGERAGIVDDSLRFAFDLLTPGTVAAGADLNLRRTPARFRCRCCRDDYHPTGADFRCPRCGAIGQATDEGLDLLIESLEYQS